MEKPYLKRNNIALVSLVIIIAFLFWYSASLQAEFQETITFLESYIGEHHFAGSLVFAALAALSAMLSPFSSVPLAPAAVAIWGKITTMILLLIGWISGGIIAYFVGRYVGYPFARMTKTYEKIESYRKKIGETTEFSLVLLFRLALPAEIPSYTLGIIKYPFWKYLLATFLSELPVALIVVYAGEAFANAQPFRFLGFVIGGLIFLTALFYLFHKKISKS